jgi:hypothetical protein
MKENNLLQKKLVHQEVLDANENYAANLEKKRFRIALQENLHLLAWMRVLIQQNMQVCQRVMPM